jgi:peptidylprolyl isomerase
LNKEKGMKKYATPFQAVQIVGALLLMCSPLMPAGICTLSAAVAGESAANGSMKNGAKEEKKLSKEEVFSDSFINKLSQAYGHLIVKTLDTPVIKLNFDAVVQGMKDGKENKTSPMNEQEYEEAVALVQEYAFQEMSQKNLAEANEFLAKNAKSSGVVELQPGKLQYVVERPGRPDGQVVKENSMPTVLYTGSYANGSVFGSTQESGEAVPILLTQTIPGFRQGLLGMKEGEKRKIFIHPDLGYGTSGQLSPNALLVFEVEVVKVEEAPQDADQDGDESSEVDVDVNGVLEADQVEIDEEQKNGSKQNPVNL